MSYKAAKRTGGREFKMAFSFKKRKRPSEKEKIWAKNQKIFRIYYWEKDYRNRRKSSPII